MDNSFKIKSLLKTLAPIKSIGNLDDAILFAGNKNTLTLCSEEFFVKSKKILQDIKKYEIRGDIILIGIWRGGSAIYIKQLMDEFKLDKKLYLIDTYEGFNSIPSAKYSKDKIAFDFFVDHFPINNNPNKEEVESNFQKLGVSLKNVFLINADTLDLYKNSINEISLLHIDVDMYEPTSSYLNKMYPKLAKGATVIVDDYGSAFFNCKDAVDDFLSENNYSNLEIGNHIALWRI